MRYLAYNDGNHCLQTRRAYCGGGRLGRAGKNVARTRSAWRCRIRISSFQHSHVPRLGDCQGKYILPDDCRAGFWAFLQYGPLLHTTFEEAGRLFVTGVFAILRARAAWRDLLAEIGWWNCVFRRFPSR